MTTLLNRLDKESDPHIISAILLSLGGYPTDSIDPNLQDALLSKAEAIYRVHANPGVHSAAEWLLRQFGRTPPVEELRSSQAEATITGDRDWYVNGQGHTFAIIRGPVEFRMGPLEQDQKGIARQDLKDDQEIISGEESVYDCRIPRTFAIATKETTLDDYRRFCAALNRPCIYPETLTPEDSCPIIDVKWFDAIRFCRWLSEQEGITEEQMCYPPISKIDQIEQQGLAGRAIDQALGENLLEKSGYRLPTAAEWEYACRAGAETNRHFGRNPAFLDQYGWYLENAERHVWPVGQLKPNDFGLFDIHGNAMEFCQNGFLQEPPPPSSGKFVVDGQDRRESFTRELRDRSWEVPRGMIRASARFDAAPAAQYHHDGFRLARTVPASESISD